MQPPGGESSTQSAPFEAKNDFAAQAAPESIVPITPSLEIAQQLDAVIPAEALQVLDRLEPPPPPIDPEPIIDFTVKPPEGLAVVRAINEKNAANAAGGDNYAGLSDKDATAAGVATANQHIKDADQTQVDQAFEKLFGKPRSQATEAELNRYDALLARDEKLWNAPRTSEPADPRSAEVTAPVASGTSTAEAVATAGPAAEALSEEAAEVEPGVTEVEAAAPAKTAADSAGDDEQPAERDPFARAKAQRESGAETTPIATEGAGDGPEEKHSDPLAVGSTENPIKDNAAENVGQNQIEADAIAKGFSPEDANRMTSIIQNPTREAYDQLTDEQKTFVKESMPSAVFAEKMKISSAGTEDRGNGFRDLEVMTDDEISEEHASLEANTNRSTAEEARYQALETAYYDRDSVKTPQKEPQAIEKSTVDGIIAEINSGNISREDVQHYGPKLREAVEQQLQVTNLVERKHNNQLGDDEFNNLPADVQEKVQKQFTDDVLFDGMSEEEKDNTLKEILDKQAQGEELDVWEKEIVENQGPVLGPEKPEEFVVRDEVNNMSPEQQKDRLAELDRRISRNETLTPKENTEHRLLKGQKEQSTKDYDRREILKAKKLNKGLSEKEDLELADLNKKLENYPLNEQQLEKAIEDLGTEFMMKLATGEKITPEEEARMQELMGQKKLAEAGFTPEQARAAAKEALKLDKGKSERESKRTQEAQEKIKKLMGIELQLISTRNLAKRLSLERKDAIKAARTAHEEAEKAKPEERVRKKGIEYGAYMKVANYNAQIEGTKYMAQKNDAERKDLEQEVRRKLGVTGGLRAMMEWSGAKMNNTMTEIIITAEEQLPFGMGDPLGAYQRHQLESSGRM